MTSREPAFYCREHSQAAGEPLAGSAPRVQTALILEFNGRWEPDVLDSVGLPDEVRAHLKMLETTLPDSRVWFIRRGKESAPGVGAGTMFYVALVRESDPALYAFRLNDYADLLALEIPAVVEGSAEYTPQRSTEPLVLVCTHGRRDRCCARFGAPAYDPMVRELGSAVWQSSHVGGHRLAANVVVLPHGMYYGRTDHLGEALPAFVDALRSGKIMLDNYRGRACYDKPVQAADYYVRRAKSITAWDALRLKSVEYPADQHWRVEFDHVAGGMRHVVVLHATPSSYRTYMNCDDSEPEFVTQFDLAGHESYPAS